MRNHQSIMIFINLDKAWDPRSSSYILSFNRISFKPTYFWDTFNFPKPICDLYMKRIFLLILIFFSVSYSYGQRGPCEPGFVQCRGSSTCIPARQCGVGPPPPGLVVPIDSKISLLIAAGLGLGIFFLVSSRKNELPD